MRPAWRTRCPRGHSNITGRSGDYYLCRTCEIKYDGSPLDAAEHDFPVADWRDHIRGETPHRYAVLGELVSLHRRGRDALKASEIECGEPKAVARQLTELRRDGLVERVERATASRWQATDAGRRFGGLSGATA